MSEDIGAYFQDLVVEAIKSPGDFQLTYTAAMGASLTRIGDEVSLYITGAEFDMVRNAMDSI